MKNAPLSVHYTLFSAYYRNYLPQLASWQTKITFCQFSLTNMETRMLYKHQSGNIFVSYNNTGSKVLWSTNYPFFMYTSHAIFAWTKFKVYPCITLFTLVHPCITLSPCMHAFTVFYAMFHLCNVLSCSCARFMSIMLYESTWHHYYATHIMLKCGFGIKFHTMRNMIGQAYELK